MKIKYIFFDYGGVFGPNSDDWNDIFSEILDVTGLSLEEMDKIWTRDWPDLKTGKKELSSIWEEARLISKKEVSAERLMKIYEKNIFLYHDVLDFVRGLKQKGYKLVMLSNESKYAMDVKVRKFHLDEIFEKIYCSAYLGMAKPDPEIFRYVLDDLGVSAEEVVFVDNQENNIGSVSKLGIRGVLFKSLEELKKNLYDMGLM